MVLQGAESYIYCKKTLDTICSIYANTDLADEVRSITMEDINTALGVKVIKDANGTPTRIYENDNVNLAEGAEGYNIDSYNGVANYEYKSGTFAPENYLGTGTKNAGDKVYRTAYSYKMSSLTKSDATAKSLIFDDTTSDSNYSKSYWVASPGATARSSRAYFGSGYVNVGYAYCGSFSSFSSNGNWDARVYAVRPIVSLKANITIDQLQVQSNIEEKSWSTSSGTLYSYGTLDSSKAIK